MTRRGRKLESMLLVAVLVTLYGALTIAVTLGFASVVSLKNAARPRPFMPNNGGLSSFRRTAALTVAVPLQSERDLVGSSRQR